MANATTLELSGRTVIYTDVEEISRDNVTDVLDTAYSTHQTNRTQIEYLYDYYRGKQPIQNRTKTIREDINNRIVQNIAYEIVDFKTGFFAGEPISYVAKSAEDNISDDLNKFNEYMRSEHKSAKDKQTADWFHICGTAYKMVYPVLAEDDEDDGFDAEEASPFRIYSLDPRETFVVYSSALGNKPMMAVKYITDENNQNIYSCWTKDSYYLISDGQITSVEANPLNRIPIIEYPANMPRLGAFEVVISLLDAINDAQSNRLDGLEQFIQSILVFRGTDITDEEFETLKERGGLKLPADGDAFYLTQDLNQSNTQTLIDNLYQNVLTICGMPNRNGRYSTSDTGAAVILRDGWSSAEARAQDTERMFDIAESEFIKLALSITNNTAGTNLRPSQIEVKYGRRTYENLQESANILSLMLSNEKIHPRLAFEHCGMFVDPEGAYRLSEEYYQSQLSADEQILADSVDEETTNSKAGLTESAEGSEIDVEEGV